MVSELRIIWKQSVQRRERTASRRGASCARKTRHLRWCQQQLLTSVSPFCVSISLFSVYRLCSLAENTQEYPTGGGNVLFLGGPPDDPGPMLLEHATVRSLRAWSVDATARAIELRPGSSRPADADTDGNPVTAAAVSI